MSETPTTPPTLRRDDEPLPRIPDHEVHPEPIGDGSYGTVYLARNVMGVWRAVKVVYRSRFSSDRPYEREFEGIRKFEPISHGHPSQLPIYHVGRNHEAGYFYYVMELADAAGGQRPEAGIRHPASGIRDPATYKPHTLRHELKARGPLPFPECLDIALALVTALEHLHGEGLVHRDIKPGNIVFVSGQPKLADIGTVAGINDRSLKHGGTLGYAPAEGPGSPAADVFSLGRVLYEMMTGKDRTEFPELPAAFEEREDHDRWLEFNEVVRRASAPKLEDRYETAAELHKALVLVQAGKSIQRQKVMERRYKGSIWAVLALAVVAVVFGVYAQLARKADRLARREVLLREARAVRTDTPELGWRSNALAQLRHAAAIRPGDDLRTEALTAFAALDATVRLRTTNFGADHLCWSADGQRLLLDGGEDAGPLQVWNGVAGEPLSLPAVGRGPVWFGSEGQPRLLREASPGVFEVVEGTTGTVLASFGFDAPMREARRGRQQLLAISTDGAKAAAAATNATGEAQLAVWDTFRSNRLVQLSQRCSALAFSPDGAWLAIGGPDGRVVLRSLTTGSETPFPPQTRARIASLAFGRDPVQPRSQSAALPWLLAVGDAGGTIWIYQLDPVRLKSTCRGSYHDVYALAFSNDGMTLASAGRNRAWLWDVAKGIPLLSLDGMDFVTALGFSPDGRRLARASLRNFNHHQHTQVVELEEAREVRSFRGLASQAGRPALSPDGERMAALAHNWEVGVWNLRSNRLERVFEAPIGVLADNAALAFSRDGSKVAYVTTGTGCRWNLATGETDQQWSFPRGLGQVLAFDESDRLLFHQWEPTPAGPGGTNVIRAWQEAGGWRTLTNFVAFEGRLYDGELSANGQFLAISGNAPGGDTRKDVQVLWDLQQVRQIGHWVVPFGVDAGVRLAPDGGAFARNERRDGVWEIKPYRLPELRPQANLPHGTTAFSPGVRWVGMQDEDSGLRLQQLAQPLRTLAWGNAFWGPSRPAFSTDGRLLGRGLANGIVLVCDPGAAMQRLQAEDLGWQAQRSGPSLKHTANR